MTSNKKQTLHHAFASLSKLQLVEIDACTQCGECLNWCPTYDALEEEALTPRGKLNALKSFIKTKYGLRALLFGPRPIHEETLSRFAENLYRCTVCGTCQTVCETGINTADLWEAARAEIVKLGKGPLPNQKTWIRRAVEKHNLYDEPTENRIDWLPPDIKTSDEAEVGYFVGCTLPYRAKTIAIATAKILKKLNVNFVLLGPEEYCCGSPLIRTGQLDLMKELVEHNVNSFVSRGVQRVVYSCAGCFRTSLIDWPKFYGKLPFEVVHITQFLAEKIDEGKLEFKKRLSANITYHDPCHLGRHARVFEAPRKVIESIPDSRLVEMERNRMLSRCCGAGGGLKAGIPDLAVTLAVTRAEDALKMASVRVQDALTIEADFLTSACPFCYLNLKDAINSQKDRFSKLKMVDLVELSAQQLGLIKI